VSYIWIMKMKCVWSKSTRLHTFIEFITQSPYKNMVCIVEHKLSPWTSLPCYFIICFQIYTAMCTQCVVVGHECKLIWFSVWQTTGCSFAIQSQQIRRVCNLVDTMSMCARRQSVKWTAGCNWGRYVCIYVLLYVCHIQWWVKCVALLLKECRVI
jgi:hypothetical protein